MVRDPDSDDARQVYADALIQAGDPRGELIQLELALAGPLAMRVRAELAQRRTELVAAHWATWFPYQVGAIRTRGGFAEAVRATWPQLAAAGALFAAEPVTELEVTTDDIAPLLGQPWLPRLRRLIVRGRIGAAGVAQLWAAPALAGLRALNLTACGLTAGALCALGAGLPALDSLVLTGNPLGDAGVAGLGGWPGLARLATLYLSGCRLSAAGVAALVAGAPLALTKLCLSRNPLGDAAADAIARAARQLPALRRLELRATGLTPAGIAAITGAGLPALAQLDVRDHRLTLAQRAGVVALASYVRI